MGRILCSLVCTVLLLGGSISASAAPYAWGENSGGQLGDGTTLDRPTPVPVSGLSGVVAIAGGC